MDPESRKKEPLHVLFLSTRNAARSQIAEALLRHESGGEMNVWSAGSQIASKVDPMARRAVRKLLGTAMRGHRPKRLAELAAIHFDYVIAVCDMAATRGLRLRGAPERLYWKLEDPTQVSGGEQERQAAFDRAALAIRNQIENWWRIRQAQGRRTKQERDAVVRYAGPQLQWQTTPASHEPMLAITHRPGSQRNCMNMCGYLERCGFQLVCSERYAETPESLQFMPDALVIRVEGRRVTEGVRPEIASAQKLRLRFAETPLLVIFRRALSETEAKALDAIGATTFRHRPRGYAYLVKALEDLVNQRRS